MEEYQQYLFDENGEPTFPLDSDAQTQSDIKASVREKIISKSPIIPGKVVTPSLFDESVRQREKKRQLSVSFPDGKTICKANATATFIEVLKEIGPENVAGIGLEVSRFPLVMKEIPERLKGACKSLSDGWYVNLLGSDAGIKYRQLSVISDKLKLGLKVSLGVGLCVNEDTSEEKIASGLRKPKDNIIVKFSDGDTLACDSPFQTFVEIIRRIGVDKLQRKGLELGGKQLISASKLYNGQVEMGKNQWLTVPSLTKNKIVWIKLIGSHMHYPMEVSVIGK